MSHHTHKAMTQSQRPPVVTTPERPIAPHPGPAITEPTHDDIARRAYDIYVKTGRPQGQCTQNWREAEQALREQAQTACREQQGSSKACEPHATGTR